MVLTITVINIKVCCPLGILIEDIEIVEIPGLTPRKAFKDAQKELPEV
ncbi:hypothetical protein [Fodinibius sediminis]|nr:hypothetical protein [Fodinibius sediminis]